MTVAEGDSMRIARIQRIATSQSTDEWLVSVPKGSTVVGVSQRTYRTPGDEGIPTGILDVFVASYSDEAYVEPQVTT